jgi:hypothetical protein
MVFGAMLVMVWQVINLDNINLDNLPDHDQQRSNSKTSGF